MIKLLSAFLVALLILAAASPAHAAAETAIVYDRRGRAIASFEGTEHAVRVIVTARWRNGRLVHTHNASANLSPQDLDVARAAGLKAICAVAGGVTCCAERIGAHWPPFDVARMTADIHALIDYQPYSTQTARQYAYLAADAAARGYGYVCS